MLADILTDRYRSVAGCGLAAVLLLLAAGCGEPPEQAQITVAALKTDLHENDQGIPLRLLRVGERGDDAFGGAEQFRMFAVQQAHETLHWPVDIPLNARLRLSFSFNADSPERTTLITAAISFRDSEGTETGLWRETILARGAERRIFLRPVDIDLAGLAQRQGQLLFSFEIQAGHPNGVKILWENPRLVQRLPRPHPNIVLICIDTLRRDHLIEAGGISSATPALAGLARDGVIFTNAWSHSSWTLPSVSSVFTGLTPSHHGGGLRVLLGEGLTEEERSKLEDEWGMLFPTGGKVYGISSLPDGVLTLPELLPPAYINHAINGNVFISQPTNLINRFDSFVDKALFGRAVTGHARQWLRENGDELFFLYLHYMDTHEYLRAYQAMGGDPSSYDRTLVRQAYGAAVEQTDAELELVLRELQESGLYDNSMIIVYSDHGEHLFDESFDSIGHGNTMQSELLAVPLIIKFPNQRWAGRMNSDEVHNIDLFKTLLHEAGVSREDPLYRSGRAIQAMLEGSGATSRVLVAESMLFNDDRIALQRGEYRLIYNLEKETFSLIDLRGKSLNPGGAAHQQRFTFLKSSMEQYLKHAERARREATSMSVSEEERERLRDIGYLQ